MAYTLSLLDKSPLGTGDTAAQALARSIDLARKAEGWGYHRYCCLLYTSPSPRDS